MADDLLANVTEIAGSKVLPPCVISGYLGGGGMGAVYRAFHLNLRRNVAVKVLRPNIVLEDPNLVERFRREGQSAAAINHQNVIRVYDVSEHSGLHYIIMELVVGETARQRIKRKGALPIGESLQITYEAALGLGEAHRQGIIHRDIKPDNLLVSNEGQVKVADLGLAKAVLGGSGNSLLSSPNQVMGTPAYMPPEQWESAATAATDVWALGATMWFLLAGRDAIQDPDNIPARMMKKILMQPFPDIRAVRPDVPDEVVELLAKATAKEEKDRFQDAIEMAEAIGMLATRRTSLRDKAAGGADAQTMLSPPPIKDLDKIKQWLRDDANTRVQTPNSLRKAVNADTGVQNRPGQQTDPVKSRAPRPAPPSGETIVQSSPTRPPAPEPESVSAGSGQSQPRPRWGLVIAMGLLLSGGGVGATWWLLRDPNQKQNPVVTDDPKPPLPKPEVSPFAKADELEQRGEFAQAIEEVVRVVAAEPSRKDDKRLARLHGREAQRRTGLKDLKGALEQLEVARSLVPEDTELRTQQGSLHQLVVSEANNLIKREKPSGAIKKNESVEFQLQLDLDAVSQLILAGVPIARDKDKKFTTTIKPDKEEIPVEAELVDKAKLPLTPLPISYLTERALSLAGTKLLGLDYDGATVIDKDTVTIEGVLDPPTARVYVDDKEVTIRRGNGTFSCDVPIQQEGQRVTLKVKARLEGYTEAEQSFAVIRLTTTPACAIEPPPAAQSAQPKIMVRVVADEWTKAVEVQANARKFPLARTPDNRLVWTGEVELVAAANTLTARATNVVDRSGASKPIQVTFTPRVVAPATIGSVLLMRPDGTQTTLDDKTPIYLNNPDATLQIECGGTDSKLTIGGDEVPVTAGKAKDVPLRQRLQEGKPVDVALVVSNSAGSATKTVRLVLDTRPPTVTISTNTGSLPRSQAVRLVGTCRDEVEVTRVGVTDGSDLDGTINAKDGSWSIELPPVNKTRTITVFAVDRAGNRSTPPLTRQLVPEDVTVKPVDPPVTPNPAPKPEASFDADGFTKFAGTRVNANGWPEELQHKETGIVLVGLDWTMGKDPTLYVAVTETTGAQFEQGGGADLLGSVRAEFIYWTWLKERGKGLKLPTEAQWDLIAAAGNAKIRNLKSGKLELVLPEKVNGPWPVKGGEDTGRQKLNDTLPGVGFRTIYVPARR